MIIKENNYFYTQYLIDYFNTMPDYINCLLLSQTSFKVNKIECLRKCNQNIDCLLVVVDDLNKRCLFFQELFKIDTYTDTSLLIPTTSYYVKNF